MTEEDNMLEIAIVLRADTTIAVSDGSFKDSRGTAAFVIEGTSSI
jgi:hypothetical protein